MTPTDPTDLRAATMATLTTVTTLLRLHLAEHSHHAIPDLDIIDRRIHQVPDAEVWPLTLSELTAQAAPYGRHLPYSCLHLTVRNDLKTITIWGRHDPTGYTEYTAPGPGQELTAHWENEGAHADVARLILNRPTHDWDLDRLTCAQRLMARKNLAPGPLVAN